VHPYLIAVAVLLLSTAGAYVSGRRDGQRIEQGKCLAQAAAVQEAAVIASQAAAEAIAKIKPVHQTINRKVQETVREVPVYRDCVNDPAVERLLNDARAGRKPADSGSLPGVSPD
jgi:hypothetical protein